MRKFLALIVLVVGSLMGTEIARAWDDPGHLVIAAVAYRQLSPEVKAQVFELLKAHPDFAAWSAAYHPKPGLDLAATVFMDSSTWPDKIKNTGSADDHPAWHFIDYPLRPPNFPFEPDSEPTNDVLYGIAQCEGILGDVQASAERRAVALSYLVHLVGDIHQLLHCGSWYDAQYPEGDRGGNLFYVKPADTGVRLHQIWDDLLGTTVNHPQQWQDATGILAKYPKSSLPELMTNLSAESWSLESRRLAITDGYLEGRLQGGLHADTAPALPAGYLAAAHAVAERQAALAGYRLAAAIEQHLKWSRELPLLPENTNTADAGILRKIGVDEASHYYDETLVVTGKVSRVTVNRNVTFIRFEQAAGAVPFTGVIFKEHAEPFGDVQKLTGRTIEMSGTMTSYRDRPEMILETAGQLTVQN
jgi:hypothetical protein